MMITVPLQIRPSDQDSLGHVNNAAYVAYVQQAVAELLARQGFGADWRQGSGHQWMMQELAIEYRLASSFGDRLAAQVSALPDEKLAGTQDEADAEPASVIGIFAIGGIDDAQ